MAPVGFLHRPGCGADEKYLCLFPSFCGMGIDAGAHEHLCRKFKPLIPARGGDCRHEIIKPELEQVGSGIGHRVLGETAGLPLTKDIDTWLSPAG